MEFQNIFSLFILSSVQTLFFIQKWDMLFPLSILIIFLIYKFFHLKPSSIYLVDFSCVKPPNSCKMPISTFIQHARIVDFLDEESVDFIEKVLTHSGQGDQTYLPPAAHSLPPRSGQKDALGEVELTLFPVFEDLLLKTKINPRDIDVLIVNCSGFCPAPSLSAIMVNKYWMREDVKSFNLSGKGCSASALAIDMAQNILKSYKNCNAVVLSTEILSTGWYPGKEQNMIVLNCMFRMGAAAILITNKKEAKYKAKYKLLHTLRTNRAFDDKAYNSATRREDSDGLTGFTFKSYILQVFGDTLRDHIMIIGKKTLPYTEQILYAFSIFRNKFMDKSVEVYIPNFKTVIQHFCLPATGKSIIKEIGKGLKLGERDMEAALMTLHRFGNQSSSSLWYELAYMEGKKRVKKGDKVWQLGMGTGPKCNSLIWECIQNISDDEARKGPWGDTISQYPIRLSQSKNVVI